MAISRIIPALAGNTHPSAGRHGRNRDHPRSRGEYRVVCKSLRYSEGSSPLSRGIRPRILPSCVAPRIIPALAGNTRKDRWRFIHSRDHPRSRGEYTRESGKTSPTQGSSPLSRGIRVHRMTGLQGHRIIPALAGNTVALTASQRGQRDHPRSRGEYERT